MADQKSDSEEVYIEVGSDRPQLLSETAPTDEGAFFRSCLGVFQGGGCRGVALVGALDAAIGAGFHFAEVAGTSAGSIVAALVGAGATPRFLYDQLTNLDFKRFLRAPEPTATRPSWTKRSLRGLTSVPGWFSVKKREIHNAYWYHGAYSSAYIQEWLDKTLAILLPTAKRPIRFQDLLIPTYVVAADVTAAEPKLWSTEYTPNEEVAYAVRCSCSIPFFFQPVDGRFVDGGVLSNLPFYVFLPKSGDRRPKSSRILTFRLLSNYEPVSSKSVFDFGKALAGAVVDGATELQCSLHDELHEVIINSGNVKATDFEAMAQDNSLSNLLFNKGQAALKQFMKSGLINLHSSKVDVSALGMDEAYFRIVDYGDYTKDEVYICDASTRWAWDLFITLIIWRMRGVRIRVLVTPSSGTASNIRKESQRRRHLVGMGAELKEVADLPFKGFLFDPSSIQRCASVVFSTEDSELATCLSGEEQFSTINALRKAIPKDFTDGSSSFIPSLAELNFQLITNQLKQVSQYVDANISPTIETLSVKDLRLTAPEIREYKYRQIANFAMLYEQHGLPLFSPIGIQLDKNVLSPVTPPVVETWGEENAVIQGNTRATYCFLNRLVAFPCVRISSVKHELPVSPIEIRRMRVVTRRKEVKYSNYAEKFRKIEEAVRPY